MFFNLENVYVGLQFLTFYSLFFTLHQEEFLELYNLTGNIASVILVLIQMLLDQSHQKTLGFIFLTRELISGTSLSAEYGKVVSDGSRFQQEQVPSLHCLVFYWTTRWSGTPTRRLFIGLQSAFLPEETQVFQYMQKDAPYYLFCFLNQSAALSNIFLVVLSWGAHELK